MTERGNRLGLDLSNVGEVTGRRTNKETDSGKYRITSKGLEIVDVDSVSGIMQNN